jgi:hypothetical protein
MPSPTKRDCVAIVKESSGNLISDDQAKELLERMKNLARGRMAQKSIQLDQALKEIVGELSAGAEMEAAAVRRAALLQEKAIRRAVEFAYESVQLHWPIPRATCGGRYRR